jgi:hypothetical protein
MLASLGPRPRYRPLVPLTDLAELEHASTFAGIDRERILHDDSALTALARADKTGAQWYGSMEPGWRPSEPGGGAGATVASRHGVLSETRAGNQAAATWQTRADYWRA